MGGGGLGHQVTAIHKMIHQEKLFLTRIIRLNCGLEQLPEITDVEAASAPLLEVVRPENPPMAATREPGRLMEPQFVELAPSPVGNTLDKEDAPPPYHTVVSLPPPYSSVSG